MKKLLLIILLLFTVNCYAEEVDMTTYIEINDIESFKQLEEYENLKEILIKNIEIDDISPLNHLSRLEKVTIFYSKVDFSNYNNKNLKEMNIISSYVVNDDLSKLANSNIEVLDLEGSYITSIYTLKNVVSLKELSLDSITNLRSLEPITYLPNLKILNFSGSEDLINEKVFNYIKDNNIVGKNYDETKYKYLDGNDITRQLDEIIENLNLDDLDIMDKIRQITIYVASHIDYDDACGVYNNCKYTDIDFNTILKSLSGTGICYNYASLTNKLLNKIGVKSYLVSGFTTKGLGHEWLNVYIDGIWYGLDPTWIKFEGRLTNLKNTGKCRYFMIDLTDKNNYFYKEHLEDVLPMDIVDPNAKIIDNIEVEDNEIIDIKDEDTDPYYTIFIGSIIVLLLFIIGIVIRLIINKRKKIIYESIKTKL